MACSLGIVVHNPDETITIHPGIGNDVADKYVVDELVQACRACALIDTSVFYKLYGSGPIPTKATPQPKTTSHYGWITHVLLHNWVSDISQTTQMKNFLSSYGRDHQGVTSLSHVIPNVNQKHPRMYRSLSRSLGRGGEDGNNIHNKSSVCLVASS